MDPHAQFYTVFEVVLSGVDFPAGISLAVLCVPEFALVFAKESFAKLKVLNCWAFSIWRKSKYDKYDKYENQSTISTIRERVNYMRHTIRSPLASRVLRVSRHACTSPTLSSFS